MAKENKDNSKYKFQGTGLSVSEKNFAKRAFNKYLSTYPNPSYSDLQLLEELVYRETIHERYKKKIGDLSKDEKVKGEKIIPRYLLEFLNENLAQQITIKDKLGLFKERTEDEYKAFQILEKKFKIWEQNHLEERKVSCPFCSEIFFLHIRTDKYKESGLKLFKNKVLCNERLWKIYKEKKITKEEFAKILNVSEDYIDFLEKKIYGKETKKKNNAT